jgi:diphthamide synthase (EF-2-diphthine--ammonia ligase)
LHQVLQGDEYEIIALLTTINQAEQRSTMHGIPVSLLQKQAAGIGLPLHIVNLQPHGEMEGYEQAMAQAVLHFSQLGVTHFIFDDIFLHDLKSYREAKLNPLGITVVEPLWGKGSATTTAEILDRRHIARLVDGDFVRNLPANADICGENGEYHTFCFGGGMFREEVSFVLGEPFQKNFPIKLSDGSSKDYAYWFANLQDANDGSAARQVTWPHNKSGRAGY